MSSIQQILASILNAVYGKDVRQAIHDGVEMAYNKADDAATSAAAAAEAASGSQESAAASAQAASDSASSASDFADAAEQYKNEAFHTTPAGYEAFVGDVNSSLNYLANTGVKNILPMSLAGIKAANTSGVWNGNVYTLDTMTFTVNTDSDGNVTSIKANGSTPSAAAVFLVYSASENATKFNNKKLNGSSGGSNSSYGIRISDVTVQTVYNFTGDTTITGLTNTGSVKVGIWIAANQSVSDKLFYPMIRDASISDSSYQPYAQSNAALTEKVTSKNLSSDVTIGDATSISNLRVFKTGNIVNIYGYIVATFTANTELIVCSLPYECTPSGNHAVRFLCAVSSHAYDPAENVGYGVINSTGQFKINTSLSGTKEAYFCVSYIAAS